RLAPTAAASSGPSTSPSAIAPDRREQSPDQRGLDGRDALFSEDQPKAAQSPAKPDASPTNRLNPLQSVNNRSEHPIVAALTSNGGHNRMAIPSQTAPQRPAPAIAAM